jgi:hypothetical protein
MSDYSNIKPGDKLIVYSGGYHMTKHILTVERLTKTQIICPGGRYNISTGREVGGDGSIYKVATEKDLQAVEIRKKLRMFAAEIKELVGYCKVDQLLENAVGITLRIETLTGLNAELEQLEKGDT